MNRNTIFEKVAEKFHTTPEEVYAKIQRVIDAGYDNPDPKVQAEWRKVKIKGNVCGKMILPPHGKEFFHSTVSSFFLPR